MADAPEKGTAGVGLGGPKLLQQVRLATRARQFSPRTEEAYTGWIRRYVHFTGYVIPGSCPRTRSSPF